MLSFSCRLETCSAIKNILQTHKTSTKTHIPHWNSTPQVPWRTAFRCVPFDWLHITRLIGVPCFMIVNQLTARNQSYIPNLRAVRRRTCLFSTSNRQYNIVTETTNQVHQSERYYLVVQEVVIFSKTSATHHENYGFRISLPILRQGRPTQPHKVIGFALTEGQDWTGTVEELTGRVLEWLSDRNTGNLPLLTRTFVPLNHRLSSLSADPTKIKRPLPLLIIQYQNSIQQPIKPQSETVLNRAYVFPDDEIFDAFHDELRALIHQLGKHSAKINWE